MVQLKITPSSFPAAMAPDPGEVMHEAMEEALSRIPSSGGRITLLFNIGPVPGGSDCVLVEVDGEVFPVGSRDLFTLLGHGRIELVRGPDEAES